MESTAILAGWWAAFAASHMALSSRTLRPRLVGWMGRGPFLGAYSVIALAIFAPMFMYYMRHKHEGGPLWVVPLTEPLRWLLYAGVAIAFTMTASAFVTLSPVVPGAPYRGPRGIHWITRHGAFMGLALWALLHLVVNGFATDAVFFGGFVVFGIVGCWHQDRRHLAGGDPVYREFWERTPFLPFTGRHALRGLRELSPLGVVLGVGITVLIRVFHADLFG